MKAKRVLASFIAMAMTMGMMSSLVLADESENAPEETSVVETTEPKEKETNKPEEKKPSETKVADPEEAVKEKEPAETTKVVEPTESEEKEPAETKTAEPSEPDQTIEPKEEKAPETTADPDSGRKEDKHAVPPKNDQVPTTEITSVQITLDAPVIGAKPDYTADLPSGANYYSESFSNEYYHNYICWLDVSANSHMYKDSALFEAEHEYQVILFLTAKDGFSFASGTSAKVNGESAKTSIDEAGHLRVAYNFPKLPSVSKIITSVSITISAPKSYDNPSYYPEFPSDAKYLYEEYSNDHYHSGICWYDITTSSYVDVKEGSFIPGHQYKVYCYLVPMKGYSFYKSTIATLNGNSASAVWEEETLLQVSYTFPTLPVIDSVSITLDAPVVGAKPDLETVLPTDAGYSVAQGDIYWFDEDLGWSLNKNTGVFMAGHQYSVIVYLTPKEGYVFTGNETAKVNGKEAETKMYYPRLRVIYTFPTLGGEATDLITSVSVTLDTPVVGAKPDYESVLPSGANYLSDDYSDENSRNNISWWDSTVRTYVNPENGVFKAGHQYIVYVKLNANYNYDFSTKAVATLNGQTADAEKKSGQLVVSYTFQRLDGEVTGYIPSVSVTLDAPIVGAKPDYEATLPSDAKYFTVTTGNNSYYHNSVGWKDITTNNFVDTSSGVFEVGHQYMAVVFLNAEEGEFFYDNTTATLNGQSADASVSNGSLVVSYTFPMLTDPSVGDTATVDGNNYKITNNNTDGTGTVTLTGVSVKRASVSIPATVVINGYVYKVNRIGAKAFYGNKTITSLTVGSNVVIIDSYAFYGCSNLVKVSGGKVLKSIGSKAFAYCSKLKSFSISSTVLNKISSYSFQKDKKLKTIYIKYTTKLTKSGVKKSLKGSKVKTVKVKKSKVKKYKKYFKKSNSGRSVKVKK